MPVYDKFSEYRAGIEFDKSYNRSAYLSWSYHLTRNWDKDDSLYDGVVEFCAFGPRKIDPPDMRDIAQCVFACNDKIQRAIGAVHRAMARHESRPGHVNRMDNAYNILGVANNGKKLRVVMNAFDEIHNTRNMKKIHTPPLLPAMVYAKSSSIDMAEFQAGEDAVRRKQKELERALEESTKPQYMGVSDTTEEGMLSVLEQYRLEEALQASLEEHGLPPPVVIHHEEDEDEEGEELNWDQSGIPWSERVD